MKMKEVKITATHTNREAMRKLLFLLMLMLPMSMSAEKTIEKFVKKQIKAYPKTRLLDIYKSCFQDYMGAEHLVSDYYSAKDYLDEELIATRLEDLQSWSYEPCGINGNYFRVSIRTVMEGTVPEEVLLSAFIRSATAEKRPSVNEWNEQWQRIIGTIDRMQLKLPNYSEDKDFLESVLAMGKYVISHSPDYRETYHPHYRIIKRDIFEQEIMPLILEKQK